MIRPLSLPADLRTIGPVIEKPLTERQELQLRACRAAMLDENCCGCHPTLGDIRFGDMTDAQLREVIAWYSRAGQAAS